MNNLLDNAIDSIELGVLDAEEAERDPRRGLSATRNLFAGVLLLIKERLRRLDPETIYKRVLPQKDEDGDVVWRGKGQNTADYTDLQDRWKSLGLRPLEWSRLNTLRRNRNNVEHLHHQGTPAALRQALYDTFSLVTVLLRDHLEATPAQVFDDEVWDILQDEAATQKELADTCRRSRDKIEGVPDAMHGIWSDLRCDACDAELVRVTRGTTYPDVDLVCDGCGEARGIIDVVVAALGEVYGREPRHEPWDGGEPSLGTCPGCWVEAYLVEADQCMACLDTKPYAACLRCTESLRLDEQHEGGLCGYCAHMSFKD